MVGPEITDSELYCTRGLPLCNDFVVLIISQPDNCYEIWISRAGLGFTSSFFGRLMQSSPSQYLAEILSPSTRFSGIVKLLWNDW